MRWTSWRLTLLLTVFAAVPAIAQTGAVSESAEWSLKLYLNLRQQVTNALPDLVICGKAASGLTNIEMLRSLATGPRRVVDSLRLLPKCPTLLRDAIRRTDNVTVFVKEWPSRSTGLFRAEACMAGCGHHRFEEYTREGVGSGRFTVWAVDD
jgi:hypothetical protein